MRTGGERALAAERSAYETTSAPGCDAMGWQTMVDSVAGWGETGLAMR